MSTECKLVDQTFQMPHIPICKWMQNTFLLLAERIFPWFEGLKPCIYKGSCQTTFKGSVQYMNFETQILYTLAH